MIVESFSNTEIGLYEGFSVFSDSADSGLSWEAMGVTNE
jgi:hypothetical protein